MTKLPRKCRRIRFGKLKSNLKLGRLNPNELIIFGCCWFRFATQQTLKPLLNERYEEQRTSASRLLISSIGGNGMEDEAEVTYPFKKDGHHVEPKWQENLRRYASWIFVIGCTFATTAFFVLAFMGAKRYPDFYAVSIEHFATVLGLPFAAIASLFIVTIFKVFIGGNLSFKFLGFEFTGASGPIVLWVVCFLAITLSICTTWEKKYSGPKSIRIEQFLSPPR